MTQHTSLRFFAAALGVLMFQACNGTEAEGKSSVAAVVEEALRLDWDDLLPQGEEDVLEGMYDSYYRNLEADLMMSQRQLGSLSQGSGVSGIEEGSELDQMPQLGTFRVVPGLNGKNIQLPGYIVPLDGGGQDKVTAFLFVPYFGACIHTPPPPPNQIVYVEIPDGKVIKDIWKPYLIEGVLSVGEFENEMGDAAYKMTLSKMKPYEFD